MKKYILCEWDQYYPSGGLGNITGSYDTLEEAIEASDKQTYGPLDNSEVFDRDTLMSVWDRDGEDDSHGVT